jgi:molybdopterin converting factor small subunit
MKVALNLYATLEKYLPEQRGRQRCEIELPEGSTLKSLIEGLLIPPGEAKIIFINGRHAGGDERLREGDQIGIFPPLGGG